MVRMKMKKKIDIEIIDKKQIPQSEPERQYYFMDIAKNYVEQLSAKKGSPLTFHVTTFGCQMNARVSEKLVGILERIGYVETDTEDADFARSTAWISFSIQRRRRCTGISSIPMSIWMY